MALTTPCARILAKHDGGAEAAKATADMAGGLETVVVLGKSARVMITRNLWQGKGDVQLRTVTMLHADCPDSVVDNSSLRQTWK